MKLLILSDSHGLREEVVEILDRHRHEVSLMIHCGDSELKEDDEIVKDLIVVKGNCDWYGDFDDEHVETIENEKIFVTHGHHYNVKMSYVPISYRAEEVAATIACFGHSHVAESFVENNVVYINPGSIKQPRGRKEKSYVICEVSGKEISVSYYEQNGKIIKGLEKKFKRH